MTKPLFLACFFLVFFLLISKSHSHASDSNNLINQTCAKTDYKELCLKSFQTDPKTRNATKVVELAQIMLNILYVKANQSLYHAIDLGSKTTDQELYRFYGTCADGFGEVVDNRVPGALEAIKSKEYKSASEYAANAASDALLCSEQFGATGSPLTRESNVVHGLSIVASDIIILLA